MGIISVILIFFIFLFAMLALYVFEYGFLDFSEKEGVVISKDIEPSCFIPPAFQCNQDSEGLFIPEAFSITVSLDGDRELVAQLEESDREVFKKIKEGSRIKFLLAKSRFLETPCVRKLQLV